MCGITGFIDSRERSQHVLERTGLEMAACMRLRGPDDDGVWTSPEVGLSLAHRRLSIVDLSPLGHQPMHSRSGRYVMVFNGEVYNFGILRGTLEQRGHTFRGHSDTEVMLASFEEWGIVNATKKFNGIFAFTLWDRDTSELHLVRDRLGVKPLYYGWINGVFAFGSELKALIAHPQFKPEIRPESIVPYLRHNYIPAPHSIYRDVFKLPNASILTLRPDDFIKPNGFEPGAGASQRSPKEYWSAKKVYEEGEAKPFTGSLQECVAQMDELLRDAIKSQMVADVPLGAFLSGGVDSSTVVALMQAQSSRPVKTFTIGMDVEQYDEAVYARDVAKHLGTEHTELKITPREAMAVIPKLPEIYDEPFSDSSQIPTYLVSELTKRSVTVSLSGDGGDEMFSGYNRYFLAKQIWNKVSWIPQRARPGLGELFRSPVWSELDSLAKSVGAKFFTPLKHRKFSEGLYKASDIVGSFGPEDFYLQLLSHWKHPAQLVRGLPEHYSESFITDFSTSINDFTKRMMLTDLTNYMADDILVKVDRASMAVSLEARVPLLDHRVVEFAATLPLNLLIKEGTGKIPLREVLYKYVPRQLIERPKMGFGIPISDWLRGDLREWAEELLSWKRLDSDGFLSPEPIREKWLEHLSGRYDWAYYLWDVLMFQAWIGSRSS